MRAIEEPPLAERSAQLEAIRQAAQRVVEGTGHVLVIEAAAGMGKTSLLTSASPALEEIGLRVLRARALEQERHFALGVVQALLGRSVDEPELSQAQIFHSLYWLISDLTQEGPIALLLDDVHEADDASLAFLSYLVARLDDLPVLVILALRPVVQVGRRAALDVLRTPDPITLPPLSAEGVASILAAQLADANDSLAEACVEASGGNPFYLLELIRELRRYPQADRTEVIRDLAPPTIVQSILMSLSRLEAGSIPLVRASAVLGDATPLRRVAELADLDLATAARLADALTDVGILDPGPEVSFAHPILHMAVLRDIGAHQRGILHLTAARILQAEGADPQEVATHLLDSAPAGSSETVALLRAAAHAATRSGSPEVARAYLARALAEPPSGDERADVAFALGVAEAALAQAGAVEHLSQGLDGAPDPETRAQRTLVIAELCRKVQAVEAGVEVLDACLEEDLAPATRARLLLERHWIARTNLATVERAAPGLADLLPAYEQPDASLRHIAAAHLAIEAAIELGTDAGAAYATEALSPPGLLAHAAPDSSPVGSLEMGLIVTEQHAQFASFAEEVAARAGRDGNVVASIWLSTNRSIELVRLGRLAEAQAECEAALALSAAHGWPPGSPELHAMLAESLLDQGRRREAREAIERAPFPVDDPQIYPVMLILAARGRIRAAEDDAAGALEDFLDCGERLLRLRADIPGMLDWRGPAALALRASGDAQGALALATENVERARRLGGPLAHADALRVLGTIQGTIDDLRDAVALAERTPSAIAQARAHLELGSALRRSGRSADAREPLGRALELADRCGALPLADRAREELRVAGGRPRRDHVTGPGALTPAELRVVRLAAGGATNTEVAQRLFVSRKTVEKHLASAYGKLGITSRSGLRGIPLP